MSLNERIAKVIEYSNFSSSEFADEIDVQRSSISHITSGRNKPSLEFIIKIKSRFPEIHWDWLITGEGEMIIAERNKISHQDFESEDLLKEEEVKSTSLSDLFTVISDEEDLNIKKEEEVMAPNSNVGESIIPQQNTVQQKISDSQPTEKSNDQVLSEAIGNQQGKIKRIVIFYDNGKFESFEP